VATGAVVSGVISLKRPAYDLWGETVNLASQMESTSEPGRIQISETTYWRVKDRFVCEPRSRLMAKGVGSVQTFFVSHGRSASSSSESHGGNESDPRKIDTPSIAAGRETETMVEPDISTTEDTAAPLASLGTLADRHERLRDLFLRAIDLGPEQRGSLLKEACGGDAELLASVKRLIDAGTRTQRLLRIVDRDASPGAQLQPGKKLADRFQIVRFIAAGGMGDVYEAEDLQLGSRLALKTIRPEVVDGAHAIARFKREIQYAQRVTHPNVCRIHDFGSHQEGDSEILFLTMELLQGETLAQHLRSRGHLNPPAALPLIIHMADALSAAHQAGIIHRDFKPSNVILLDSATGQKAVITDFGLARSWSPEGDASLTEAGKMVGTVAYMAPEQLTHGKVTPATDVYALGLVIYEMVTGRKPFGGEEPMDMAARRLTGLPPPSPSYFSPDLDSRWEVAIIRCLQVEPARRPQTPQEVVSALKASVGKAEGHR
jgi:hypothetical protein